ncbi:MAG: hypothetical protein P4L51_01885 [Puia sp.]|nr:hypothetical protein [Puia sp.]
MQKRFLQYKQPVWILCAQYFLVVLSLHAQNSLPQNSDSSSIKLNPIPVYLYKAGMRFYFPDDTLVQASEILMPGYSHYKTRVIVYNIGTYDHYDRLAKKTYRLISADTVAVYNEFGDKQYSYYFRFIGLDETTAATPGDTLSYVFPVYGARETSRMEDLEKKKQSFVLPGAILIDDVEKAGKYLKGKHFYTRFSIKSGGNALNYQEVVITDVTSGTPYTPIRVTYKPLKTNETGWKDVVTTGTNVLAVYWKDHMFPDYFQTDDPRKALGKITDTVWNSICQGKVTLKMTAGQVEAALGKPATPLPTITAAGEDDEWDYDSVKVFLNNGVVYKIQPTGKKK